MKQTFGVYWIFRDRVDISSGVIVTDFLRPISQPFTSEEDAIISVEALVREHPAEKYTILPIFEREW